MWKLIDLLPWWGKLILLVCLLTVARIYIGLLVLAFIVESLINRK